MATTTRNAPIFASWDPNTFNTGPEVIISIPIGITGSVAATDIWVTSATLGFATRLSPAAFPMFVGDLLPGNNAGINLRFSRARLNAGSRYLLTIRGKYRDSIGTRGFAVNRFITVPAEAPYPVDLLKARLDVALQTNSWSYTIANDEAIASNLFVNSISLDIVAPITVTGTPSGWELVTDNNSFVLWHAPNASDQIAPGNSLGGFMIQSATARSESTSYVMTSWNQSANVAGLVIPDVVLSPSRVF